MTSKVNPEIKKTDYSFLLKCMAGVAAAAVAAAGILAIVAATTSTSIGASLFVAASFLGPIGALAGLAILVGAACLSPCFGRGGSTIYTTPVRPVYNSWGLFSNPGLPFNSRPVHCHTSGSMNPHVGGFGHNTHTHGGGFFPSAGGSVHHHGAHHGSHHTGGAAGTVHSHR